MGFWTTTPKGKFIHIKGALDMSDEALDAIGRLFDSAAELSQRVARLQIERVNWSMCAGCDAFYTCADMPPDCARYR